MRVPDLAAALAARPLRQVPALPGRRNDRPAAVLVAVRTGREPAVILIERAGHLRDHAGEIGFPGGKPEPGDADLVATARREAHEELGLRVEAVLGRLSSMPLYTSDYRLHPVVAALPETPLRPDPGEVAAIIDLPLRPWLGRAIPGVPWDWQGRTVYSPVFAVGQGRLAYGGTAHVLLELLEVIAPLLGAPPPVVQGGFRWSPAGPVPA